MRLRRLDWRLLNHTTLDWFLNRSCECWHGGDIFIHSVSLCCGVWPQRFWLFISMWSVLQRCVRHGCCLWLEVSPHDINFSRFVEGRWQVCCWISVLFVRIGLRNSLFCCSMEFSVSSIRAKSRLLSISRISLCALLSGEIEVCVIGSQWTSVHNTTESGLKSLITSLPHSNCSLGIKLVIDRSASSACFREWVRIIWCGLFHARSMWWRIVWSGSHWQGTFKSLHKEWGLVFPRSEFFIKGSYWVSACCFHVFDKVQLFCSTSF